MAKESVICSEDKGYFDLEYVYDCFNSSLLEEDDVDLGCYLDAYKELSKFCELMGSVFGFVGSEIDSKSEVLTELRNGKQGREKENFVSLKRMVRHEMGSGLLSNPKYVSGCRTLLRLHRGLDFIRHFLKKVSELEDSDHTSHVGREVYYKTLGQYHPWIIRKGASIAMYVLPNRANLLKSVCGDRVEASLAVLPRMLEATNKVYDRTEICFKNNDLLNLP